MLTTRFALAARPRAPHLGEAQFPSTIVSRGRTICLAADQKIRSDRQEKRPRHARWAACF